MRCFSIGFKPKFAAGLRVPLGLTKGTHYHNEFISYFRGWHFKTILFVVDQTRLGLRWQYQVQYHPICAGRWVEVDETS